MRFGLILLLFPLCLWGRDRIPDYVYDQAPSARAKASFASAVPKGTVRKVVKADSGDKEGVYFTEDGSISIPPGTMIEFKGEGKCMDPKLPAPRAGEPMQFVNTDRLIPRKLRETYAGLIERYGRKDPEVMANNPQHLVWALRTAGTDSPMANNLSSSQRKLLDKCAGGGHEVFSRYHEREKRRNQKLSKKKRDRADLEHITVGNFTYDAADLVGSNSVQQVDRHIETLVEMGAQAKESAQGDFRYGEIEDELYSDVVGEGGLSYRARVLNTSDKRKDFHLTGFAAQVGFGADGTKRQRVTMSLPESVEVVAVEADASEVERRLSAQETEVEVRTPRRERTLKRRKEKSASGSFSQSSEVTGPTTIRTEETTSATSIQGGNEDVVRLGAAQLKYDEIQRRGTLILEIKSGSFKKASKHIREHIADLLKEAGRKTGVRLPSGVTPEIETISVNAQDQCEVYFSVGESGETRK